MLRHVTWNRTPFPSQSVWISCCSQKPNRSRGSVISLGTRLRSVRSWVRISAGAGAFFFTPRPSVGPIQPLIQWFNGGFFPEGTATEAWDYIRPSSAGFMNEWISTSSRPVCLEGVCRERLYLLPTALTGWFFFFVNSGFSVTYQLYFL